MKIASFSLLFLITFLLACQPDPQTFSKTPPLNTPSTTPKEDIKKPADKLVRIGEGKEGFWIIGPGVESAQDINKVVEVGITHTDFKNEPGINQQNESAYNNFWNLYLKDPWKKPEDVILALEMGKADVPILELGQVYPMTEPFHFLTPFVFNKGVRLFIMTDPRGRSAELHQIYIEAINMFEKKEGKFSEMSELGDKLPVVDILKEPNFTAEDLKWLKDVWKPVCFLPQQEMEKNMFSAGQQYGAIGVVGMVHALSMYYKYNIPIAMIGSQEQISSSCKIIRLQDYYLKLIK